MWDQIVPEQPTPNLNSVVRLHLHHSGFNPSPGPGLAASGRGRSNGSSVWIQFILVLGIISPSLDLAGPLSMISRWKRERRAPAQLSGLWCSNQAASSPSPSIHSFRARAKAHAVDRKSVV